MHLLPQEDSLAGYTRAVVEATERNRRCMDQIDIEMEEKLAAQKKEHEMKMKTDPEYRKQYEELEYERRFWTEAEAFERARIAEEEAYQKSKELERIKEIKNRRRRFDALVRCLADNYDKGLASGGVREACFICKEYFIHGEKADVTREDFEKAFKIVLAFAYQNCSDDTMAEEFFCDEDCEGRKKFYFCKGEVLLKSNTGKKCPYSTINN